MRRVGQSEYPDELRAEALFLRERTTLARSAIAALLPGLAGEHSVGSFEKSRNRGWVPPPVPEARQAELLRAASTVEGCIIRPPKDEDEGQGSLLPAPTPVVPPQRAVPIDNAEDHANISLDDVMAVYAQRGGANLDQLGIDHSELIAQVESYKAAAEELARTNAALEEANEELTEENAKLVRNNKKWRTRSEAAERLLSFYMTDTYYSDEENDGE